MSDYLLLQKQVDMSVLSEGFSIPVQFQETFYEKLGFRLNKGESCNITIIIEGEELTAVLKNQTFNEQKFVGHSDVMQIRYSPQSTIAKKLRAIFKSTDNIVLKYKAERSDKKKKLIIPSEQLEYIAVYATPIKGTLLMDCITVSEYQNETEEIIKLDEREFETAIDEGATIELKTSTRKVRKLSRAIGDNLKLAYGYCCQICGECVGERYDSHIVHSHHIDYFTKSLNNNSDNIMIVCPNHHGIIHDKNPQFIRKDLTFIYPNGYMETLKLNKHL